jgi:hypothetical protein
MTFEERLTRLEAALAQRAQELPAAWRGRLVATFDATSPEAAEELASWWRRHSGVEIRVVEAAPTSRADVEKHAVKMGAKVEGTLVLHRDTPAWVVEIRGVPVHAAALNINAWIDLLRHTPQDARWIYSGGAVEEA